MATAAEQRIGDFNPQGLANMAWACAAAGHKHALLFAALGTAAEWHIGAFKAQVLNLTGWSFAMAD